MVEVVDIVGEVLDEHGITGTVRATYRAFARQLLTLWRKGRAQVRAVACDPITAKGDLARFAIAGLRARVYKHYKDNCVTVTASVKSEEQLVRAYCIIYGLKREVLESIRQRLAMEEQIVVIL